MSLAFFLVALASHALADPGDLDLTFGGTGKVTTPIGTSSDLANAVALQADGKIVAVGNSFDGSNWDFAVVRYNTNGTLDTTFGGTGKVTTPIGTGEEALSMALQADGKIVAAGYSHNGSKTDFAVVRYNTDGTLDSSFGGTGKVTTPIGPSGDIGRAVALQADGKIVAAGNSFNGNDDFAVVRYNTDGTLDTTFGGTGKVTTPIGTSHEQGLAVAMQADGKIVVAGISDYNGTNNYDFAIVRYNADGTLDTTFGGTGKVTTPIGTSNDFAHSVALQADGKIVAAGLSAMGNADFAVVRYNTNGTLDTTFGGTGKVTTPSTMDEAAYSVALQADGKIVAAGISFDGSNSDFAVVRYDTNGTLDTTFGGTGKVTTPIGTSFDRARSVALQADGKIVAAGGSYDGSTDDFAVVRYEGGPTCGNGVPEVSEQCDEGVANGVPPSCCSATCAYEPASTPCADGDLCNGDETCDGAGTCQAGAALDCDDADACTQDSCNSIDGCENSPEPAATCLDTWAKATLLVKESVPGKEKVIAKLLKGPALSQNAMGAPLTSGGTAYTACIYGSAGNLAGKLEVDRAGAQCAGKDCWKKVGTKGFLYKDKDASADGVQTLKLLGGDAGKSKILLKAGNNSAKGQTSLPTGIAALLAGSSSATVQFHGSDLASCFSTTLDTVVKDDGGQFKAKR